MNQFLAKRTLALVLAAALVTSITLAAGVAVAQTEPTPLGEETGPLAAGTYVDSSTGPNVVSASMTAGESPASRCPRWARSWRQSDSMAS